MVGCDVREEWAEQRILGDVLPVDDRRHPKKSRSPAGPLEEGRHWLLVLGVHR